MIKTKILFSALFSLLLVPISQAHAKTYTHIGEMKTVRAAYEDTLVHMARANNLGFTDIRSANPTLDPWIPGAGAEVIVPNMHLLPEAEQKGIVINLPEMRLYRFFKDGRTPVSYPIGIGREGLETPQGLTKVTHKVAGPTWRPTERMREEDPTLPAVVPPGPDNPLGTHALYLDFPLIRIHGTNKPYGIGRRTSSGCIRMYPESIIELYDQVPSGTQVNVINQEVKVQWIGNELYVEAHPSIENVTSMEKDGKIPASEPKEADIAYISRIAGDQVINLDWDEIRTILSERRGYPIQVAERGTKRTKVTPVTVTPAKEAVTQKTEVKPAIVKQKTVVKKESTTVKTVEPAETQEREAFYRAN
ncbi:MAG: hypothetical protein CL565_02775 [Alphaproteobacteria bacterium]|nr:hypothetical protein [Alphaproteobacteria bacterium]|tara:strand:- start:170 stop:1255 length:1086 start_codon:yes stop_codon:yes gene_type:complete